ncbi:MAG: hypothetical protein LUC44_07270 [Prevotellaceae bacterium]|nr:hypothetical protein [Prevotellaceae bacterium]
MKAKTLFVALLAGAASAAQAQTDVTDTYMQNPDFEARYAGWLDEGATKGAVGGFTHQTSTDFEGKSGEVFMEKWVASGKVSNVSISQTLNNMPTGTYTLTVSAQNIKQSDTSATQTGAFLFAGDAETEVSQAGDYSVTFQVIDGSVKVGFKTVGATGNWVCIDNFRLYQLDDDMDGIHTALQALIDEGEETLGDGATAQELQTAITNAKALLSAGNTDGVEEAARALERATLNYKISNGEGSVPTVETTPFVAQGATIALGRGTVTAGEATIAEEGFCWSEDPDPTVLDNKTTEYFTNNGKIFRMENLSPATIYYVRAYAISDTWQVGYGDVVKIATKPKGSVSYWYNYGGSDQENFRINSALSECEWMYNNVANIKGFSISCTYGASTETADCSYGGSMRVGPSSSYQQTGTILHETNHGVGVGTTWQWYSDATLRENTSSGKWLGPHANEMVQFLQNDAAAYMTGDGTHMWGATTSSITMKNYGINGAFEDSYSPADQLLYWGNILLTHALHIDGLPCSSSVGFATPSFVFAQEDGVKYYIKCEDTELGLTSYLGHSATGSLKNVAASAEEALSDDELAWYISFNPATQYYTFQNVGSGKYIGLSSGDLKAQASSAASIHLLPSRELVNIGDEECHSYWITSSKGAYSLRAGSSLCSTVSFDNTDEASSQRWLLLTADELQAYDSEVAKELIPGLDSLIANVRETLQVEHIAASDTADVSNLDESLEATLELVEKEKDSYTSAYQITEATETIETALIDFLGQVTPASMSEPFDISYLLDNPTLDDDNSGWSDEPTYSNNCCEYMTASNFDFNQTTSLKLPKGTYSVHVQAFQRPGAYKDVYTDYVKNGVDNAKAVLYAKSTSVTIKNIFADAQSKTQGTGTVRAGTGAYIPNTMEGAYNFFKNGLYNNSVVVTTTSAATFKLGLRCAAISDGTEYWTCFRNFRLLYYGTYSGDEVSPVEAIEADETEAEGDCYDLSGRKVSRPTRGIYIQNGKKVLIK